MTDSLLSSDRRRLPELLQMAMQEAVGFLGSLAERPVAPVPPVITPLGLLETGLGAQGALDTFRERYAPWISGSAGPRYFAFVTGGSTPAALVGDWLTSAYDQNGSDAAESSTRQIALDALGMLRDLFGLPETFQGVFVSGATTSAMVALATARQWVGQIRGVNPSMDGVHAVGPIRVLSSAAHSSIPKALAVIGLGRAALHRRCDPPVPGSCRC
jgi:glutamate/tyrosine decarboxylase-like PLP-dependent enzyme